MKLKKNNKDVSIELWCNSEPVKYVPGAARILQFLYSTGLGRILLRAFAQRWLGCFCGWLYSTSLSRHAIVPFIKSHTVDMSEALLEVDQYQSFNDFFVRRLKPQARSIDQDPCAIVSPSDSMIFAHENIDQDTLIFAKNTCVTLPRLLGDERLAAHYYEGTLIVCRLAPEHYHRFHSPVGGIVSMPRSIAGGYHSVHPTATVSGSAPVAENYRHIIEINTQICGRVIMIPIGALCVGTIIETYIPNTRLNKGDELGYFSFGGSMVMLLFERGMITVNPELIVTRERGTETFIRMGERIATLQ